MHDDMQIFSKTPWYVIPLIWLPIAGYLFLRSILQYTLGNLALPLFTTDPIAPIRLLLTTSITYTAFAQTMACFFFGNLVWTFLEYTLHRFLFHVDFYLPDHPYAFALHFTLHGIHHYLPMDRYVTALSDLSALSDDILFRLRLVMPPALFAALSFPFTRLAHVVFPAAMANGVIAGAYVFCKFTFGCAFVLVAYQFAQTSFMM